MKTKMIAALGGLGLVACASAPVPAERNAGTEASIRGAQEAGADGVPAARLHLQMAKDQEAEAARMAAAGDERASLVASRSRADAELALGLAKEAQVHQEATRAADDLKGVRARAITAPEPTTSPVRSVP